MAQLFVNLSQLEGLGLHLIEVLLLLIVSQIVIKLMKRWLLRILHVKAMRLGDRRRDTLFSLFENVIRYTVYLLFVLTALNTLGVHIVALLAGAGIAGLALGFGAQGLIKDVLTGFFILFEDQYGVGDAVQINGFTGTVTSIGLRLTRIKAWTGELAIIPNGQINQVINYSEHNSLAIIDIGIGYAADIDQACQVMKEVLEDMKGDVDIMTGPISILGVQSLQASNVLVRATAECKPNASAVVVREAQKRIKSAFDRAGIELPFPQTVITLDRSRHRDHP